MAYRDNVSALAAKEGVPNDPGLREEDLGIAKLLFCDHDFEVMTTIEATAMNRGGRLFFQSKDLYFAHGQLRNTIGLGMILAKAEEYFAELWEPNPEPGKRALLDAIRNPHHAVVQVVWKDGWEK
jgi:hypothetical protein